MSKTKLRMKMKQKLWSGFGIEIENNVINS